MKTIFEKIPLTLKNGETVTLTLPEPFRISDSLFLIVHNAVGEKLKLTFANAEGDNVSHYFLLESFPAVLVFPEYTDAEQVFLNDKAFTVATFTAYRDFEIQTSCRTKNPAKVIASHRD